MLKATFLSDAPAVDGLNIPAIVTALNGEQGTVIDSYVSVDDEGNATNYYSIVFENYGGEFVGIPEQCLDLTQVEDPTPTTDGDTHGDA